MTQHDTHGYTYHRHNWCWLAKAKSSVNNFPQDKLFPALRKSFRTDRDMASKAYHVSSSWSSTAGRTEIVFILSGQLISVSTLQIIRENDRSLPWAKPGKILTSNRFNKRHCWKGTVKGKGYRLREILISKNPPAEPRQFFNTCAENNHCLRF